MSQIARRRIGLAEANDIRREQSKVPAQRFHVFAKFQPSSGAGIGGMAHENVFSFADFPIVSTVFTRLNEFLGYTTHWSNLLFFICCTNTLHRTRLNYNRPLRHSRENGNPGFPP